MSSLHDQLDARKQRLQRLRSHCQQDKDENIRKDRNELNTANSGTSQSNDKIITVEEISAEIEKRTLVGNEGSALDEISTLPIDQSKYEGDNQQNDVPINRVGMMDSHLKNDLEQLERKTDAQIKRILQRRLLLDALNESS